MNVAHDAPRRPALRYYGGGWKRAPWTIAHMPTHDNYVEPCFGAGSVLLRKDPVQLETVNDIDGRVVNFFHVLRERSQDLVNLISLTPWAEDELHVCLGRADQNLEDARRFFMACWMNIHGNPANRTSGFRYQKSIENRYTPPPHDAIGRDDLLTIARRLKRVQILNRDALDVIKKFKDQQCLIYFDPPYLAETRSRTNGYMHEVTPAWHRYAACLLRQARGYVVVAGYASRLYERVYEDYGWWRVDRKQRTNGYSQGTESLWLSPRTAEDLQCEIDTREEEALPLLALAGAL